MFDLTPLGRFYRLFQLALLIAEAKDSFQGKALAVQARIDRIVYGPEPGAGNTAFVVGIDVPQTIKELIANHYENKPLPATNAVFLAERG